MFQQDWMFAPNDNGLVLLVLGAMHFFNLAVFTKMRRRALTPRVPPMIRMATA